MSDAATSGVDAPDATGGAAAGHASASPGSRQRLRRLPGLDGLRALAVAAVVLFHFGISQMPGGFLGVDLFFVLSGFLITTLLLREHTRTGDVSYGGFWGRRARRLFPALVPLLLAAAAYAEWLAPAAGRGAIRGDIIASVFYVANWRFAYGSVGYFAAAAGPSPVLHLWSLSVEEQWYVIFPLLMGYLLLRRIERAALPVVLAGMAFASFLLMWALREGGSSITRLYMGTDTRAGTILVGAVLAALLASRKLPQRLGPVLPVTGPLALVGIAAFFVFAHGESRWMYPFGFGLFALLAAVLIISTALSAASPLTKVLELAPLVWLGTISYGVYLWHWIVGLTLTPERTHLGFAPLLTVRIVATLALAALSYVLLEHPVRSGELPRLATVPVALGAAAIVIVAAVVATAGAPTNKLGLAARTGSAGVVRLGSAAHPVKVGVVGDSVAFTLAFYKPDFVGLDVEGHAMIGCGIMAPASTDPTQPASTYCRSWEPEWEHAAAGRDIMLASLGVWETKTSWFDGQKLVAGTPEAAAYLDRQLDRSIAVIEGSGVHRIAFLDVSCPFPAAVDELGQPEALNQPLAVVWFNEALSRAVARHPGVATLLSARDVLCRNGKAVDLQGGPKLRDDGIHLNERGAGDVWKAIGPQLVKLAAMKQGTLPAALPPAG